MYDCSNFSSAEKRSDSILASWNASNDLQDSQHGAMNLEAVKTDQNNQPVCITGSYSVKGVIS